MTLFTFDNTTAINSVERDFGFKPLSFKQYLAEQGV
jgi:NADH dehydrogenase